MKAKHLKTWLTVNNKSVAQLAKKANISSMTIRRILAGKTRYHHSGTIKKLSKAIGLNVTA